MKIARWMSAAVFAIAASSASSVFALAQRTFVSVGGNDAFACSVTQPCRTFAHAIGQTAAGGEVVVLDSGGYGAVTIGKAVSIVAPAGIHAAITVFSGAGVTVAAGTGDRVVLRGLALETQTAATNGVVFASGGQLEISDCTIDGPFGNGVEINGPLDADVWIHRLKAIGASAGVNITGPGGEGLRFTMAESVLTGVNAGIQINAGGQFTIDRTAIVGTTTSASCCNGIAALAEATHAPIEVNVTDSLIRGFSIDVGSAQVVPSAHVSVTNSELSYSAVAAVVAFGGATVAIAGNRIVHNANATNAASGGTVFTSGTNYSAYNGGLGTLSGPVGSF